MKVGRPPQRGITPNKIRVLRCHRKHLNFEKTAQELGMSKQAVYLIIKDMTNNWEYYRAIALDFLELELKYKE